MVQQGFLRATRKRKNVRVNVDHGIKRQVSISQTIIAITSGEFCAY